MEKRPPTGIWGGLWSLPELAMDESVDEVIKENWQLLVCSGPLKAFLQTDDCQLITFLKTSGLS